MTEKEVNDYMADVIMHRRASIETVEEAYRDGYNKAREELEKQKEINKDYVDENEALKIQIEKMKCCENCKQFENPERIQVGFGDWKDICDYCNKNDRWELAE